MVKHCMKVIRKTIQHINPNQITIITGDQSVYALSQQIQWKYPNQFGDNFLIMMGGASYRDGNAESPGYAVFIFFEANLGHFWIKVQGEIFSGIQVIPSL